LVTQKAENVALSTRLFPAMQQNEPNPFGHIKDWCIPFLFLRVSSSVAAPKPVLLATIASKTAHSSWKSLSSLLQRFAQSNLLLFRNEFNWLISLCLLHILLLVVVCHV
jgi:hypothetical protein